MSTDTRQIMKGSKRLPNSLKHYQGNKFRYLPKEVTKNRYLGNKIRNLGNDFC